MGLYASILIMLSLLVFNILHVYSHANLTNYNLKVQVQCPVTPSSCKGISGNDGRVVVTLSSGYEVMCDTATDGGGWIIFQRRINGKVDFYRGWNDYKYGFGDFKLGEFYLGNEIVHQLTIKKRFEMRVDLRFNNTNYYARYARFRLDGEKEYYILKISNFSGNATDHLLSYHVDQKFTTFDNDNDNLYDGNCADVHGAWWFSGCGYTNLNGKWASKQAYMGVHWFGLTGWSNSVTMSEMKMREI